MDFKDQLIPNSGTRQAAYVTSSSETHSLILISVFYYNKNLSTDGLIMGSCVKLNHIIIYI